MRLGLGIGLIFGRPQPAGDDTFPGGGQSAWLMEDAASGWLMEDGISFWLME